MGQLSSDLIISFQEKYYDYIESLGIAKSRSRFTPQFETLNRVWTSPRFKERLEIEEAEVANFGYAIYDLTELYDIFQVIKDLKQSDELKARVRRLNLRGSEQNKETNLNNDGRNVQFELLMLSNMINAGLRSSLGEPNPDIEYKNQRYRYAIECKRIFSENESQIKRNIGLARDQLLDSINKDSATVGVIALDLTRLLTQGDRMFQVKDDSDNKLGEYLRYELDNLRLKYRKYWLPDRIKDPRIASVLLHISVLIQDISTGRLGHIAFYFADKIGFNGHSGNHFYKSLTEDLLEPMTTTASRVYTYDNY